MIAFNHNKIIRLFFLICRRHFVALKTNLLDWNWTEGFPTIDDVSPRPLNRLNVALTFTLLLGTVIFLHYSQICIMPVFF